MPTIDLTGTEWPDLPNSEVVNAAIARARGRVNGYPDRHASSIRALLAERHGVAAEQIVVGNGAAELLQTAAFTLLGPGDELVTPWPSYPLYPLMASRAGARSGAGGATRARCSTRSASARACWCSATRTTPPGTYVRRPRSRALAHALPEHVHLLVDEAFVQFQDLEPEDSVLRLVDEYERLLVVPHLLEDLRPLGAARRLRGGVGRSRPAARLAGPRAGRERADPGGGRAGAAASATARWRAAASW